MTYIPSVLIPPVVIVKALFLCIFIILAISGNLSILHVIKKCRTLQITPNYFIASLALSDLLYAAMGSISMVVTTIGKTWLLGNVACQIIGVTNTMLLLTSIWTLIAISINRYIALSRPFCVDEIFTARRTIRIILLIWITAFFFSIPPLFGWSRFVSGVNTCSFDALEDVGYTILLTLIGYVSAALILPILYIKVYKLIKKHQHLKAAMTSMVITSTCTTLKTGNTISEQSNTNCFLESLQISKIKDKLSTLKNKILRKSKKYIVNKCDDNATGLSNIAKLKTIRFQVHLTRSLAFLVIAFFFCWTPLVAAATLYMLGLRPTNFGMITFGMVITCLNGVLNPFIYGVKNKNFRRELCRTFKNS